MENQRSIADEIEGAASIVAPLTVGVLAEALEISESEVVAGVEELEAGGRATSSRLGVVASESRISPTRLAHLASRVAEILQRTGAPAIQVGRALLAAGDARAAHQAFVDAISEQTATAQERAEAVDLAIESGTEARVSPSTLASLRVTRARTNRNRGDHDLAVADLEAATPHLSGEELVDAYGFAAAVYDDRQQPADAERVLAMGMLVAARDGLDAKLGSLLTFQGRLLARLGFDDETERVFSRGTELVNTHGTELQRHYAALNQAWTDLDRGWAARAESRYSAARGRAAQDEPVTLAELDIAIARAKFAAGDASGASELLDSADRVADETSAPVLGFLGALARAEGAIAFHQPMAAIEAAARFSEIVDESFPRWKNRAATVQARALLAAQRPGEAREALRRGFEATPRGANGLRIRTELEALALMADDRWDEERATDVADRLLQGGWLSAAAALLTERARREKRPELGRAAAALAYRIGAIPAAADAIEAAGAWGEPAAGPVALAVQRVSHTVPEGWRATWVAHPAIEHALGVDTATETADEDQLLAHLDAALTQVGLAGTEVVLSPSQRRKAGLVSSGSKVLSMGRFVGFVAAAGIVAAVVAIALRPEPVEIPVAASTTTVVTTTTLPPLLDRILPIEGELSGQVAFAGGDHRNAVFDVALGEPTGVYWKSQLTGFIRSEPVLRGRGLYIGDSEGWIYGLDITQNGAVVFESQLPGAIDTSVAVDQVNFLQDAQGKVLTFGGDDRGNALVRHINDTEGEVWTSNLGSPITGPALVRAESMIVATEEGVLIDLLPSDGTEVRRFPAEGAIEGGFAGPLTADNGFIYARTSEGAVIVIEEATFTEVCTAFSPAAQATTNPVVDGDRWYFGSSARTIRMFRAGSCSESGIGSLQVDTPVNFAPAIADGVLWAIADAVLLPLDVETGQGVGFVVAAGGAMTAAPVIAGDLVLIVTEAGDLVAVSRADGSEVWRVSFGTPIRTRPLVADGFVIVSTARGEIIALAAPVS